MINLQIRALFLFFLASVVLFSKAYSDESKHQNATKEYNGIGKTSLIYKSSNSAIFKDFAHSPSKVKATSEAVRKQFPQIRLIACFELHTYSSLNPAFLNKYRDTLNNVDECYIYYSEKNIFFLQDT